MATTTSNATTSATITPPQENTDKVNTHVHVNMPEEELNRIEKFKRIGKK